MSLLLDFLESWHDKNGSVQSTDEILNWIEERTKKLNVKIEKTDFSYDGFWHYDEADGFIRNDRNSFFQIAGYQSIINKTVVCEQPVLIQDEIGYLGILCKKINGVLNFLMQAKIEPGNVNHIQISPTIQATKSNFTRKHGGKAPAYLEYFLNPSEHALIVEDQVQSEQSSRFFKKRNRNILIYLEDEIEVLPSHKWMTLGQIKELLKYDNLVNMDTRTVLSGIPFTEWTFEEGEHERAKALFKDPSLFSSLFNNHNTRLIHELFHAINNHKMFHETTGKLVPLKDLKSWSLGTQTIECNRSYDFKVVYCNIEIEGREVQKWEQPLFEANGLLMLGLFTRVEKGVREFLVKVRNEIGCFDVAEVGPTIQLEPSNPRNELDPIESLFLKKYDQKENLLKDVILSEEGGRFYHEQNNNVIIEVTNDELKSLPDDYFWVDYYTLNRMIQFPNVLNIQLRNLLTLVDM